MSVGRRTHDEETTSLHAATHEPARDRSGTTALSLHLVRDGVVTSYPLEPGKTLVVGRARDADIFVGDAAVSRRHLAIDVGDAITVRDLGSANGVRVGSILLERGKSVAIEPGTVVEVGSAMLVLQRSASVAAPRRVWSHGYYEGRVQDECSRAERLDRQFAILRLRVSPAENEPRVLDELSRSLKPADVIALYGPGDVEALLLDQAGAEATRLSGSVVARLAAQGVTTTAAVACYPADGRAADALLAVAGERLLSGAARPTQASAQRAVYGSHLAELQRRLEPIARSEISVLILGETGVGKELVAEMLHRLSRRAKKPFVRINCGAFVETLLASELFGHERGAFTGADRAKLGLIESADGGTIFLDEIGELPLTLQPKLLRVLEQGEVTRVGALRPKHVDVRFVSATHRDLENDAQHEFRKDLYFRLAAHTEVVLPLRERRAELPELARGLLAEAAQAAGKPPPRIEADAMALLQAYAWPGNVRELRNMMQRALLLATGDTIGVSELPADRLTMRVAAPSLVADEGALRAALDAHERQRVIDALAECGGNQTHAAKALGISRGTLLARIEAFGLARPRKR